MASRGQSMTLSYYAWDAVNGVPKTGDVANHIMRLIKDGGAPTAPTNAAAEIDATNAKGWYKVVLTSAETTADVLVLAGVSSSTGIVISGTQITLENLPTAAPNASNGIITFGSGAGQLNVASGKSPATLGSTDYSGNTVQTGDAYARIGAAGAGLTAVPASGDFTSTMKTSIGTAVAASNVAGVTGVTFPATVASPTNITAGTITNLTNLPAITTDWITASGVSAAAATKIQSGLSTYAGGDTPGTTTLLSRLSGARAGYLDNIATAPPTAAAVAAAILTDTSDNTTSGSPGKILAQLGSAFTTASSSVFSSASLANAQTGGGGGPDAATIADKILGRNVAGGSDGGRTVSQAMFFLRNKWTISGGTLRVYATDDATTSWTAVVTTAAGNPVTSSDPA